VIEHPERILKARVECLANKLEYARGEYLRIAHACMVAEEGESFAPPLPKKANIEAMAKRQLDREVIEKLYGVLL
jgi:hypothetical protein